MSWTLDLRKLAGDMTCTIRIPDICCGGPGVLCHINRTGQNGMGMRAGTDWSAIVACHRCHDAIDGRAPGIERYSAYYWQAISRAMAETHERFFEIAQKHIDWQEEKIKALRGERDHWRHRAA